MCPLFSEVTSVEFYPFHFFLSKFKSVWMNHPMPHCILTSTHNSVEVPVLHSRCLSIVLGSCVPSMYIGQNLLLKDNTKQPTFHIFFLIILSSHFHELWQNLTKFYKFFETLKKELKKNHFPGLMKLSSIYSRAWAAALGRLKAAGEVHNEAQLAQQRRSLLNSIYFRTGLSQLYNLII